MALSDEHTNTHTGNLEVLCYAVYLINRFVSECAVNGIHMLLDKMLSLFIEGQFNLNSVLHGLKLSEFPITELRND